MSLPKLMVAPNGARLQKTEHPAVPVTLAEIVETARECWNHGADGLHAHVRDAEGQHVLDAGLYRELLSELQNIVPQMHIQITTEAVGRYTPREQRDLVTKVQPRAVSVALREMCAEADLPAVRRFYHQCHEAEIAVQHILYDLADIAQFAQLRQAGVIPCASQQALIVLGRYTANRLALPQALDAPRSALLQAVPEADWAVCAFGHHETACLQRAHREGGKLRVGFENNLRHADGSLAKDNASRVVEVLSVL